MSWIIKILKRDFEKIDVTWTGVMWNEVSQGNADFVINDFQFTESTWREVSFTPVAEEDFTFRDDVNSTVTLDSNSKRYQFLNPLVEEVEVVLPLIPKFHERYLIKNLSEVNNKLLVKETASGDVIFTLDSVDELAILFHDEVEWQISI